MATKNCVTTKICVIGYFDHGNLGDDMFRYALQKYVFTNTSIIDRDIEVDFKNIDSITKDEIKDYQTIFFGPGDVMNDYFLGKLGELCVPQDIPIYALGVGFPYPSFIEGNCGILNPFDYIIHRNSSDKELLLKHVPEDRLLHTPDITWFIANDCKTLTTTPITYSSRTSKKIGVCLTRNIFNPDQPEHYESIVDGIGKFFAELIIGDVTNNNRGWCTRTKFRVNGCFSCVKVDYEIYFVPFYCHPKGPQAKVLQDDRIINVDVYNSIFKHISAVYDDEVAEMLMNLAVHTFDSQPVQSDVLGLFSFFDLVVASRFHAHVFSAITSTPFVSIYTTRKVELLLKELGLHDKGISYSLPTDPDTNFPTSLSADILKNCFSATIANYNTIKKELHQINSVNRVKMDKLKCTLSNLIYYNPKSMPTCDYIYKKAQKCAKEIMKAYPSAFTEKTLEDIVQTKGIIGMSVGAGGGASGGGRKRL